MPDRRHKAKGMRTGSPALYALKCALEFVVCMPSQHHAVGLWTGCMVAVLAPLVEAARSPLVCPIPLGYGSPSLY